MRGAARRRAPLRPLAKTVLRTGAYVRAALLVRAPWREQAPVVWGMVAAAAWLGASAAGNERTPGALALVALLLAVLLAIAAFDARWGIIPDAFTAAVAALGLAAGRLAGDGPHDLLVVLGAAALVYGAGRALHALHRALRGYDGFGLGDVKLIAAATPWVGLGALPDMVVVAVASALASLALHRCSAPLSRRDAIAFGPHLALALSVVVALQPLRPAALFSGFLAGALS